MGVISRLYNFVAGTPAVADQVDAEFDQILGVLNGNVDAANLAAGAVTIPKLATAVLNNFPKLATSADRKIAFGGPYDDGASWGVAPERLLDVPHGVAGGVTPVWAMAIATPAASTASATDPVGVSGPVLMNTSIIRFRLRTLQGGNCNFPGVSVYWIAIF
jgi:hypothetical protein